METEPFLQYIASVVLVCRIIVRSSKKDYPLVIREYSEFLRLGYNLYDAVIRTIYSLCASRDVAEKLRTTRELAHKSA